ncbi:hypothetical protein JHK87_053008 [Glycine soja]|nr:hypothetical protein JHK87_053008 [Glycine soja]
MMYQSRNEVHCRNLMVETTGAIVRFKKVVSLLNSGLGHARCCGDRRIVPPASSTSKARTTVLPLRCVVALVGSSYDRSTP